MLALLLAAPVQAVLIDFEDLGVSSGGQLDPVDNAVITSGGFDFVNGPGSSVLDLHFPNANGLDIGGTTELVSHEEVIMSPNGGGTFTLNQFDWGSRFSEAGTFTVHGDLFGGGTVSQVFALDGNTSTFETFVLPGTFTNLVSVLFEHIGGTQGIQNIDNIVVNTVVPEPGSIAAMLSLVGFGAGAMVIRRRRAKKLAA